MSEQATEDEVVAAIERSETEKLCVSLTSFKGHRYVSLRVWARMTDGEWRPVARKGCSIRVKELEDVHDALGYIIQRLNAEARR